LCFVRPFLLIHQSGSAYFASSAFFSQTLVLSAQQALVLSQAQVSQVQVFVESALQQQAASTFVLSAAVASALLAAFLPPQDITVNENATAIAAINTFVFIFVIALNV
jgi:hypothetical protein